MRTGLRRPGGPRDRSGERDDAHDTGDCGLRSPHKIKFGVSRCARECAEARGKDVGIIATKHGWNLYVAGNGDQTPKHAQLLASDDDDDDAGPFHRPLSDVLEHCGTESWLVSTRQGRWLDGIPSSTGTLRPLLASNAIVGSGSSGLERDRPAPDLDHAERAVDARDLMVGEVLA